MHIVPAHSEIDRGIRWRPDLILFDVQALDVVNGSELVKRLCRSGSQVCVIDSPDNDERKAAWQRFSPRKSSMEANLSTSFSERLLAS